MSGVKQPSFMLWARGERGVRDYLRVDDLGKMFAHGGGNWGSVALGQCEAVGDEGSMGPSHRGTRRYCRSSMAVSGLGYSSMLMIGSFTTTPIEPQGLPSGPEI